MPDDTTEVRNEIAAQLHRDARSLRRRSLGRDQHTSYKLLLQAFTLHTAAAKIASEPEPAADVEIEELRVEVAAAEEGITDLRHGPDDTTEDATFLFLEALQMAIDCKVATAEWQVEGELLEAVSLIARARLGRTGVKNPHDLARWRIDRALEALKDEEAKR